MSGYTRQSVADIIASAVIKAAPVNAEFNALRDAFEAGTGHRHDGDTGEGGFVPLIADIDGNNRVTVDTINNRISVFVEVSGSQVEQLRIQDGVIVPVTDNDIDLGTASLEFKDLYIDGIAKIDTLTVDENATIAGTLGVTGNTTLSANLVVNGNTTIGDADTDTVTITADVASPLIPSADDTYDIGAVGSEWRNLYIDGTANIDSLIADTADINGGTIDGTAIGGSTPAAGAFTTVSTSSTATLSGNTTVGGTLGVTGATTLSGALTVAGTTTLNGNTVIGNADTDTVTVTADVASNLIPSADNTYDLGASGSEWKDLYIDGTANIDSLVADTADINAGTIDGATIGGNSAAAGTFTDLTSSGTSTHATVDINGGNIDGTTIGAASAAAITGTTVTATTNFVGDITGDVTGNVTGNVSGNLTGNVTGNVTGNLSGNVTGNVTGDLTGNVTATTGTSSFAAVTTSGNVTVGGDLTVNGTTTTINTTNTIVKDELIELGNGTTGTPTNDAGIVIERGTEANAFIGFDESADKFTVGTGSFTGASTGDLTITTGTLVANIEGNVTGDLTGNADTATALETPRTIAGQSFDGTANISIAPTNLTGVTATASEINIIDGDTGATATTLVDTDTVIVNDAGTIKQVALSDFETFFESALDTLSNVTTVGALNAGSITSGFGSIDVGADAISTTGTVTFGTLSDGVINISSFVDEDDMASDSATLVPTQQSVKAYVDTVAGSANNVVGLTATGAELNVLDGDTTPVSVTLVGTDGFPVNDAGTTKLALVSDISTYIQGETVSFTNATLTTPTVSGLYLSDSGFVVEGSSADANETTVTFANPTADRTITFPNASGTVFLTGSTDLAVIDGGTGASDAATARTNLGLAIGTNVQAWDTNLDQLAALAVTDGNFIVGNGSAWVAESGSTARTSLGLGTIATQNSNSVSITGGSITGITDLAVTDGGTGASSFTANNVLLGNGTSAFQTVAPGTSGNVLTSNGTTWESVAPSGGGATIEAVASGTLSNGSTVVVNSDGTVSVVSGVSQETGTPTIVASVNFLRPSATFDSSTNRVVIAYRDNTNSGFGTAIVGTVSGTSISFGTPVVFESASTDEPSATFDSSTNRVVIAYRDLGNSSFGTAIVGTVSGTSISFGTAVVFENSFTGGVDGTIKATFDSSNNKVVIAYRDAGNSGFGTAVVGTVSGTSISFGTPVVFESADTGGTGGGISATFDSTNNKVVIAYRDDGNSFFGTAIIGTVSGTSISFGTPVVFASLNTQAISAVFDSSNNKVVIAYRDASTEFGTAIVGTVSGTSISFGTAVVFESANTSPISATFDNSAERIVIAYRDIANSSFGTAIVGAVSGTSISFGAPQVFESGNTEQIFATFDSTNNRVVIAYRDAGNSDFGTAVVFKTGATNLTESNFIGFSDGAYTDAQTATVQVVGSVDDAQSGLTPAQKYYVQADGTLSTTPAAGLEVYAGVAVAATKILVKG